MFIFKVDFSLTFYGIEADSSRFSLTDSLLRIDLKSCLRNEDISPSVSLNKLLQTLRYITVNCVIHL
jgi:hypothetical protein